MRLAAIAVVALSLATAGLAQLTPGTVVRSGQAFPVVADFNGDGLDDLVQERNVLLNNGGSFGEPRDLALPSAERVIGVLDVNGDHLPDLLTLETSAIAPPSLSPQPGREEPLYRLYIGNAARHYAKGIPVASGPQPYVADVDGDSKDDLVIFTPVRPDGVRTTAMDTSVLRSLGNGTFERLAPFRIPADPQIVPDYRILTGDLNHDGLPDLVIRAASDLVVLRGLGGGRFAVESRYLPQTPRLGGWSTRLADIDGDANLDVIMAAQRSVRVLFGDGRGKFPRSATAPVAKLHDIAGLPAGLAGLLHVDDLNQPRNVAIGHFARGDREQVAVGTVEGDLVVFSYERGALREVSRTITDFWGLDIRPGSFRNDGGTGVYVVGSLVWGSGPQPRVFDATISSAAQVAEPAPARRRASGPVAAAGPGAAATTSLRVELSGACMASAQDRWTFAREGSFGIAHQGETNVEAVFDGADIYYRLSAPYLPQTIQGVLTEANGAYSGNVMVVTSCGLNTVSVTARPD
jgi:hypothetical protein